MQPAGLGKDGDDGIHSVHVGGFRILGRLGEEVSHCDLGTPPLGSGVPSPQVVPRLEEACLEELLEPIGLWSNCHLLLTEVTEVPVPLVTLEEVLAL
jgi:hypothetical protein